MSINNLTLTAANSNLLIRCKGYFDQYVKIQGFQVDNAFAAGDQTIGEVRAGIDGILSGGYVFNPADFTVYIEPNSPSKAFFSTCVNGIKEKKETVPFDFSVELPSIKKRYTFSGFLTSAPTGVSAQKMLAGVQYVFSCDNSKEEDI